MILLGYLTGYRWGIGSPHLTTPLVFDGSLSYLEMIAALRHRIEEIQNEWDLYLLKEDFAKFVEYFENDQKRQDVETDKKINDAIIYLKQLIEDVTVGQILVVDPTFGKYPRPIEIVVRQIYDRLRDYGSYTARQYDERVSPNVSAKEWDEMTFTVFEFDLYSKPLFGGESPNPTPDPNTPGEKALALLSALGIDVEADATNLKHVIDTRMPEYPTAEPWGEPKENT